MHKAAFAHVDTGMVGATVLSEHHQVTGAQAGRGDAGAPINQTAGGARRHDTGALLVHIADQATAIKPASGRVAAVAIGRAHQAQRVKSDVVRLLVRQRCMRRGA